MKKIFFVSLLVVVTAIPALAAGGAREFFRIRKDAEGRAIALDTAIARYEGSVGGRTITVDLVSAIHVGESAYYAQLNKEFETYDSVLYELIAPEERKIPPKDAERPDNVVSALQGMIKNLLVLEFQLDAVNYQAKNFVHADLSPEEFHNAMTERGDSIWTILARVLVQDLFPEDKAGGSTKDLKILMALLSSNEQTRAYRLRRYLAEDFGEVEELVSRIEGAAGSAIIADRNARAIEVLGKEIKAGKSRFAIFYGGAHMTDMEKRMLERFPLKETQKRWIVAWRLQQQV